MGGVRSDRCAWGAISTRRGNDLILRGLADGHSGLGGASSYRGRERGLHAVMGGKGSGRHARNEAGGGGESAGGRGVQYRDGRVRGKLYCGRK
ncbi:hypothetical protein Tco_0003539 [Tanacetum coccineum]